MEINKFYALTFLNNTITTKVKLIDIQVKSSSPTYYIFEYIEGANKIFENSPIKNGFSLSEGSIKSIKYEEIK